MPKNFKLIEQLIRPSSELQQKVTTANTYNDLPQLIQQQMQNKEDFEFFLNQYLNLSKQINIKILVEKAIEFNSIEAAVILLTKTEHLKRLRTETEKFKQLLNHYINNLQWLHTVSSQLSLSLLKETLGENHELFKAIKEFKSKANDTNENSTNSTIESLFKPENPWANTNLAYFIANPKPCSYCLRKTQITDMFSLASTQQILSLCWALVKTRIKLLKYYFTTSERDEGPLKYKVQTSLTTQSSKQATDFLTSNSSVTVELFKLDANNLDIGTFKKYLLHSHNPRLIIKAHGDLIIKQANSVSQIKRLKEVNAAANLLSNNNASIEEFTTNFHLLVEFKTGLLRKALEMPNVKAAVMNKLTAEDSRNEWIMMHLKENPDLVKALCKDSSDNFLKLLNLTDDPGKFLRELAGKVDSKDRARIIFQSVIQIARYTKEHPEYQPEFNKMLEERFWLNFGYRRVKYIAIDYLSNELRNLNKVNVSDSVDPGIDPKFIIEEADLAFIIENENLRQLFNLTKSQLQQLAENYFKKPSSHHALAEHYYDKLDLESETPQKAQAIRSKSIHYILKLIEPEYRRIALNEALYYGVIEQVQDPQAKKLISVSPEHLFDRPLELLKDLDKSDFDNFYKYYVEQIEKIKTIPELDALKSRFNGSVHDKNLISPIEKRKEFITKKQMLKVIKRPLADDPDSLLYSYAKVHGIEALLSLELDIDKEVIKKKVVYEAIIQNDWEYINQVESFKTIFLTLMAERDFQTNGDKQIAKILVDNIADKDFIIQVIKSLDSSLAHPEIDKAFLDSNALTLACIQFKGEWDSDHLNNMLLWFDKNNLTHAKIAVEKLLFTQGSLLVLMQIAQLNPVLKDKILASSEILQRFTTQPLTEEEASVFLAWYCNKADVKQAFRQILPDFILLNKENSQFTNKLISDLSEGKRLVLLKDTRIDSSFIAQNPSLIAYKKLHTQANLRKEIMDSSALLSKVVHVFEKLPVQAIEFFQNEHSELFLRVLNQKELIEGLAEETRVAFDNALVQGLSEDIFVKALLKDENKQAAIAIVTSKNEKLREAFWAAASAVPKLVAQVIEAILENSTEINEHKDIINKYLQTFSSDKSAISVRSHQNIVAITEKARVLDLSAPTKPIISQTTSLTKVSSHKETIPIREKKEDISQISRERITTETSQSELNKRGLNNVAISVSDFHYIEDIYRFLSEHRNVNISHLINVFKQLQTSNSKLLELAYQRAFTTDYAINTLLNQIKENLPIEVTKPVVVPVKSAREDKRNSKREFQTNGQDEDYLKFKEVSEKIVEDTTKRIKKYKQQSMLQQKKVDKKLSRIDKLFKDLQDHAEKNTADRARTITKQATAVLAGYQAIKCQYLLLEELTKNTYLNIQSTKNKGATKEEHLNEIARTYGLTSTDKLNTSLNCVLKQAQTYLQEGKYHLAANYYQEVINACHEDENIDSSIRYKATEALISLLIQEPTIQIESNVSSEQSIKNLFQSFFSEFTNKFIKDKVANFPPKWLTSPAIFNALKENLEKDNPNEKLVEWVVKCSENKHEDIIIEKNLDNLRKILDTKRFIIRHEDSGANSDEQSALLREIYARDPDLLSDSRFKFNLEAVMATTSESLDILLFFLRNTQLAKNLLSVSKESQDMQELYELGKKNELIKFVLTVCYPHLTEQIDKDAFNQTIIITQSDNSLKSEEKDVPGNNSHQEDPPLAPPPPPGPPPPPPPGPRPLKIPNKPSDDTSKDKSISGQPTDSDKKTSPTGNPIVTLKDIASAGKRLKAPDLSTRQKPVEKESGNKANDIANMIAARNEKRIGTAWQAMMFTKEKQFSTCGQLILQALIKSANTENDVPADIKRGFADVYDKVMRCRIEDITVELILKEIQLNSDLKGEITQSNELLSKLAMELCEVIKSKKPTVVEKPKPVPSKPVAVKELAIKPETQVEKGILDNSSGLNLGTFLGNFEQIVKIKAPIINLYNRFISMQKGEDKTSEEELVKELIKILDDNMLAKVKDEIQELSQKTEDPGPPLEKVLADKAHQIFNKIKEVYQSYLPKNQSTTSTGALLRDIRKRANPNQLAVFQLHNSQKIYDLVSESQKVFIEENIKAALGKDNEASLKEFEAKIWSAIEKIQRGNRISRDVLLGNLYGIADKRNRDKFTEDFDKFIWAPLKIYANSIGKQLNVVDQIERKVSSAPDNKSIYADKVFNRDELENVIEKDQFINLGYLLADKINAINLNKPVFRDELWDKINPIMVMRQDKTEVFDNLIWGSIKVYAAKHGKSELVQEKDPLREKMSNQRFFGNNKLEGSKQEPNSTLVITNS
ncbi:hypothetical protein [Legionella gresilensis]|uniref:hypothetical protein n=1 Tax=Legionella gresilensis TaxID=91823 RepID=UPI0010411DDB|nr:hypothetical protein [Legionella gresilensis]